MAEVDSLRLGRGREVEEPALIGERLAVGDVKPLEDQQAALRPQDTLVRMVRRRRADLPRQQFEGIGLAPVGDQRRDVGDFEHGGHHMRLGDHGAGLLVAHHQAFADQALDGLVDGHARAAVVGHQGRFSGKPMAGAPLSGTDLRFELGPDAPLETGGLGEGGLGHHAASSFFKVCR